MPIIYKSIASPTPKGSSRDWSKLEKLTVPDQSLSLQDILDRFSRKEALPVGKDPSYNDEIEIDSPFAVDLEKLGQADILDKMEHAEQWREISDTFKREEAARVAKKTAADKKAAKEAENERIEKEVQARIAKESSKPSAV